MSVPFAIVEHMKQIPLLRPASLARSQALRNHRDRGVDGTLTAVLARPETVVVVAHRGSLLISRGELHRLSNMSAPTASAAHCEAASHAAGAVADTGAPGMSGVMGTDLPDSAAPAKAATANATTAQSPDTPSATTAQPLLTQLGPLDGTRVYLGQDAGIDFVGLALNDSSRAALDSHLDLAQSSNAESSLTEPESRLQAGTPSWVDLRDLAVALDDLNVGLACALVAVGNWHAAHPMSPRSGNPTEPVHGGWVRADAQTGSEHFPRTDPAVIMAVVHTDDAGVEHLLMGNNIAWPKNRFSILAGFVEPGETLERAVQREVFEESGVLCANPRYLGSQPWPFPCSLMLGFSAEATTTELQHDPGEMAEVRWFTRTELREAASAGGITMPGRVSIAGQIIHAWLANGE